MPDSGIAHGVYQYHAGQAPDERRRTYAQLRELEKEGEGHVLLTTGSAAEASILDTPIMRGGKSHRGLFMPTLFVSSRNGS